MGFVDHATPIGTKVRYYPVAGHPGYTETATRSTPWEIGSGQLVVALVGYAGGKAADHCEVAEISKCRECGCTDDDCMGCIERTGEPCTWVEPGLCSACVPRELA